MGDDRYATSTPAEQTTQSFAKVQLATDGAADPVANRRSVNPATVIELEDKDKGKDRALAAVEIRLGIATTTRLPRRTSMSP